MKRSAILACRVPSRVLQTHFTVARLSRFFFHFFFNRRYLFSRQNFVLVHFGQTGFKPRSVCRIERYTLDITYTRIFPPTPYCPRTHVRAFLKHKIANILSGREKGAKTSVSRRRILSRLSAKKYRTRRRPRDTRDVCMCVCM